jgi:hypothetical protein
MFSLWELFKDFTYSAFKASHSVGIFSSEFTVAATCVLVPLLILFRVFGPAYQTAGIRYRPETGWRNGNEDDLALAQKGIVLPPQKKQKGLWGDREAVIKASKGSVKAKKE